MRSSEGGQLFPRKRKRKIHGEKLGIYQNYFFFIFFHAIKLKVNGLNCLKAKNYRENLYQSGFFFRSRLFSTE